MIRTSFPSTDPGRHRVPDLRLVGLLGRPDVVFHLQARQVVESQKVTQATPGEPAAAGQRDDHVRLELGALDLVRDVPAQPVDVLPVRDGTREVVRQVAHVLVCIFADLRCFEREVDQRETSVARTECERRSREPGTTRESCGSRSGRDNG